jgi:hypothetical protein
MLTALVVAASFSGCATAPVLNPPGTEFRAGLGRVAVVSLTNAPRIRYQLPESRADVAAERASFEVVTPWMVARKEGEIFGPIVGGDPRNPLAMASAAVAYSSPAVIMVGAPLWQELRRAYGVIVADSAADVATARAELDAAVTQVRFIDELRDRLLAELTRKAPTVTTVPTRSSADTILELFVYEPNISSATGEGINPGLGLSLGLRVRLLDARTGDELAYDYLDYRGPRHTLARWAADDALLFRAELERCLAHLSAEIAAQLFTREPGRPIDRSSLAAVGIERRPASPVTPAGGTLWSPPRSRGVYARN